ncbi:S8 family peptidase [Methylocaldum sp.]|uniref:S8 family peptidase n=1 Tax=Methylocaldum sp. TaxID=1969727 RepID=UPI002D2B7171|nr:S8 family serine peptidase [Methylocaldum sp.]HYE35968.1 S8 family serine peptidase [Methylocaldum sp.]
MQAPKGSVSAKVGQTLSKLHNEYRAFQGRAANTHAKPETFQPRTEMVQVRGNYVAIYAVASNDSGVLRAGLEKLGMKDVTVSGRVVSGWLPIPAIGQLEAVPGLQFVRPAYPPIKRSGSVDSQGDAAMRSNTARMSFGVDGNGIAIGVLSNSYNCLGGAENDIASGDLPSGITVLKDDDLCPPGTVPTTDEGRAMMQIIHDVAPGAQILFHTDGEDQFKFADAVIVLANAGAKIIVDDVGYFDEPMFQDGHSAQAIDEAVAKGVAYFSSAGNENRSSYEAPFRPSGTLIDEGGGFICEAHDFDPGPDINVFQHITVPPGSGLTMSFQWDAPFFSVSGPPGAPNDIDVLLYDEAGTLVAETKDINIGSDPKEILRFFNLPESGTSGFNVQITNCPGPNPEVINPGLMKYVLWDGTIDQFNTHSSTVIGHANAAGAAAVGAAPYHTPHVLREFSSAGGTPILFDTAGNRKASPEFRFQPLIVAPDDINTSFFGGQDTEPDGAPNFPGTSAAAPHAAAVAALMLQADPSLSPWDIYTAMANTAIDMDDPFTPDFDTGFDFASGCGFIQADAAIANPYGNRCLGN